MMAPADGTFALVRSIWSQHFQHCAACQEATKDGPREDWLTDRCDSLRKRVSGHIERGMRVAR